MQGLKDKSLDMILSQRELSKMCLGSENTPKVEEDSADDMDDQEEIGEPSRDTEAEKERDSEFFEKIYSHLRITNIQAINEKLQIKKGPNKGF